MTNNKLNSQTREKIIELLSQIKAVLTMLYERGILIYEKNILIRAGNNINYDIVLWMYTA